MKQIVTRFAPSPTGYLHIGGARTALFAWLYAKSYGGDCLLRIEDTDKERSEDKYTHEIINSFRWLGINFDQDIVYQSHNTNRYNEMIDSLLKTGGAYVCPGNDTDDDKKFREKDLQRGSNTVVRFKMPTEGYTTFNDLVKGELQVSNDQLDDFIIERSDGSATYNFCVVVDDIDSEISHVIRGDDHVNNTFKQINVLNAFGAKIPSYAHLPMVLAESGKRLSKRDGAKDILDYKEEGYLSDALINYLVRLGWSYGEEEVFSLDELKKIFKLNQVNSSPSKYSKDLLDWYNNKYLNFLTPKELISKVKENSGTDFNQIDNGEQAISLLAKGANSLNQIAEESSYFFEEPETKFASLSIDTDKKLLLSKFSKQLKEIDFKKNEIEKYIKEFLESNNLKFPELGKPLRVILTGKVNAPSISELLFILGKETSLKRIEYTLND